MPVLARVFEEAGLSTVLVTMMPYWAEKVGTPRTLAVEFPFSQTIGEVGDVSQQMRVLHQALNILATAQSAGATIHSDEVWPVDQKVAYKKWQPSEAAPIIKVLAPKIRELMKQRRNT